MTVKTLDSTGVTMSGASPKPNRATIVAVLLAAALLAWPFVANERFVFHIAINVCLAAIAAASLHLIIRTGHVSLCHAAFIGIGAYTSAYVVMQLGLPFIAGLALGTFAAALLALLIGPVILRLTGKYFVLITFLFGEIVRMVFVDWQAVTGGANGITDIPAPAPIFAEPRNFYWLTLLAAALCIGFCGRLLQSELGRTIDSIREDEQLAECSGVPVIRIKVMIFVIACALAGFVGSLQAHYTHYISPQAYSPIESLNYVIMNVIGGMNTLVGPLIGALFLVLTPEFLRGYVQVQQILFGLILIIVMAFLPGGIANLRSALRTLLGPKRRDALR